MRKASSCGSRGRVKLFLLLMCSIRLRMLIGLDVSEGRSLAWDIGRAYMEFFALLPKPRARVFEEQCISIGERVYSCIES